MSAGDLKAIRDKSNPGARPQLSILQRNGLVHGVRGTEYGAAKYSRGNYFGPPPAGIDPVDRFAGYIDAALRHLTHIAQAINTAKGTGGDARAACAVVDDEASGGFPPSMLPHIAHAIAGLMIGVECGVSDGLLPADPGQPWINHPLYKDVQERRAVAKSAVAGVLADAASSMGLPQKDDPDAEGERIAALRAKTERAVDAKAGPVAAFDAEIEAGFGRKSHGELPL